MPQGRYSQVGALFANHILRLEAEGFAQWLLDSFGGPEPAPVAGWFMYDGANDFPFNDALGLVIHEFEDDVLGVGDAAVSLALKGLPATASTDGLAILNNLALQFRCYLRPTP